MIKAIIYNLLLLVFISGCATTQSVIDNKNLIQEAEQAYQQQNWKLAEAKYTQLVADIPGDAELWFRLGNIYAHSHQASKAITAYKEAVIRNPKMAKAWHNMGVMSLRSTTHLFIEMLQYLDPDDPLHEQAKKTGAQLLVLMQQRRESNQDGLDQIESVLPKTNAISEPVHDKSTGN